MLYCRLRNYNWLMMADKSGLIYFKCARPRKVKLESPPSSTTVIFTTMSESQLSEMGFPALEQNPGADSPAPSAGPSAGGFKKRAKTSSLQKSLRKPAPSVPTISVSDDDLDDDDSDEEQSRQSSGVIAGKKRKRGGLLQAASTRKSTKEEIGVIYDVNQSSGSQLDPKSQATAVSAEFSDAELLGRTKTAPVEGSSDNMYRGQNAYRTLIPKREQITTKYNAMGPQKSASNIRMTTYTDYAPGMFFVL